MSQTILLDGREVAVKVKTEIAEDVRAFEKKFKRKPQLAVVCVGDDPASQVYLRHKEKASLEAGFSFLRFDIDKKNNQEDLDSLIIRLNGDSDVHGILVQLPMPPQFKIENVLSAMNPLKDSDGFHPENLGLLLTGHPRVKPCTPFGVMKLLEHYKIEVAGKKAVVIGRSMIVGKPMAHLLLEANATVTICHSKTKDIKSYTKDADIVVVAAGQPQMFDHSYFGQQTVVVDVGIHRQNGKVIGDVDFASCQGKVRAISPVPGGVGQMTVAMLLKNTLEIAKIQESHRIL